MRAQVSLVFIISLMVGCSGDSITPSADTETRTDTNATDGGANDTNIDDVDSGVPQQDMNVSIDATEDSGPGATCTHTTQGGIYGSTACSESFQCCDGQWRDQENGCGTCLCTEPTGATGCGAPPVTPGPFPYVGLSMNGSEIPREGLNNPTGSVGVEPHGTIVVEDGRQWVRGTISNFGGPNDTGVTPSETGAITGENLRALNTPLNPTPEDVAANPEDYYYLAMRWNYSPNGRDFWKDARIIIRNPSNGRMVVVRPVDWGPHQRTGRIVDVAPKTEDDLGASTDDEVDVAFAPEGTPLGLVSPP